VFDSIVVGLGVAEHVSVDDLQEWVERQPLNPSQVVSILVASAAEKARAAGFSVSEFQEVIDAVRSITWGSDVTRPQQTGSSDCSVLPTA
jgi:hypothetical protein